MSLQAKLNQVDTRSEIAKRKHTIMLLGYDVIGHSAGSNVDRMKELRTEIANLESYGTAHPGLAQRLIRALGLTEPRKNAKDTTNLSEESK